MYKFIINPPSFDSFVILSYGLYIVFCMLLVPNVEYSSDEEKKQIVNVVIPCGGDCAKIYLKLHKIFEY